MDKELIKEILAFRDRRDWKQFHNPKDLSISISLEASELLEKFQWSGDDLAVADKKDDMKEEYTLISLTRTGSSTHRNSKRRSMPILIYAA